MSTSDRSAILLALVATSACNVFDHQLDAAPQGDCTSHAECTDRLAGPARCIQDPIAHCVQLQSDDCPIVTGDATDDRSVLIASLLSVTGVQGAANLPRQQAAIMAVEEINATNASGGILESNAPGDVRKLVMLSCDEAANLPRAATHLVSELHVTAIVGPNLSQDTLDLTLGNPAVGLPSSAQGGTAVFSPTANASAVATVPDNGLTFMMVPSDVQRVPLMKIWINQLESTIKTARSKTSIKFAVYYRGDALGKGTRDGLDTLTINGASLASQISLGKAREDEYDPASTNNSALVSAYVQFQPDIIVVVGTGEAIKYFTTPLEAAWQAQQPTVPKPYYVGIDSVKVSDLITAVTGNEDLRLRWSGGGVTTSAETLPVFSAFQIAYGQRWKDAMGNPQPATQSGMGPSYDAVYTIALGLVGEPTPTGASLVAGIPRLASHGSSCTYDQSGVIAPCFTVSDHARTLYRNMGMLLDNAQVAEIGTTGRLAWDTSGAKSDGAIEIWCINATGPKPIYASSGLTYNVKTQTQAGTYTQCGP